MAEVTGRGEEAREVPLNDDVLDEIISRVSPFDLVAASSVSRSWRRAVLFSPRRRIPWLIIHLRGSLTRAYDPHSRSWIQIQVRNSTSRASSLRSFLHPGRLLHAFSPSSLDFSTDPFGALWCRVPPPPISVRETIVAHVDARLVVICTASRCCQVYNLHAAARRWKECEPVPDALSQHSFDLSVAAIDRELYLLSKPSGILCTFNPAARRWGRISRIHPEQAYSIGIGTAGGRLIYVVATNTNMKLWEVVLHEMGGVRDVREIGRMPAGMAKRLMMGDLAPVSLEFSAAGDFGYICNSMDPKREVILVEFLRDGGCRWESVASPGGGVGEKGLVLPYEMVFRCAAVGLNDLSLVCSAVGLNDQKQVANISQPVRQNSWFESILGHLCGSSRSSS